MGTPLRAPTSADLLCGSAFTLTAAPPRSQRQRPACQWRHHTGAAQPGYPTCRHIPGHDKSTHCSSDAPLKSHTTQQLAASSNGHNRLESQVLYLHTVLNGLDESTLMARHCLMQHPVACFTIICLTPCHSTAHALSNGWPLPPVRMRRPAVTQPGGAASPWSGCRRPPRTSRQHPASPPRTGSLRAAHHPPACLSGPQGTPCRHASSLKGADGNCLHATS